MKTKECVHNKQYNSMQKVDAALFLDLRFLIQKKIQENKLVYTLHRTQSVHVSRVPKAVFPQNAHPKSVSELGATVSNCENLTKITSFHKNEGGREFLDYSSYLLSSRRDILLPFFV
jgi:hypothetical protein